ncbi:hypothetical protein [Chryseobacterium sp. EO14]|uniref:hypothetical protein n=1 Tax=Chryseobacterium sp. EO14 TaxID=2950551 RepID=UPI00210B8886|nr:hypothetical protein [Chryseobacterium sp. EO14]MCQ4139217.1 hypothetical protein [Chryseobacterium sp. EO14]
MEDNAIFKVEFDKESFVKNIGEAFAAADKFEDKMSDLSNSADKVNFTKPISQINKLKEELTSAFKATNGKLNLNEDQINKSVDNIVKSGPKIKEFLNALKKDLKTATDPEEFNTLREAIKLTENALAELSGEEVKNEEVTKSAKARLREMKAELIALEDAGLDDTEMFRRLTVEAAQLTDQLGDQAEQIRVLSSDTFAMDASVDILSQLAAGWGLAEGALQLFGVSTEEADAQMQKLVAIQSVMNGLQEVHAFLTGQSAGKLAILNGWNKAVAISTALVATVTGEATVATRAFSTALAATGVGAIVIALGLLIYKWEEIKDAIMGTSEATRAFEKATEEATGGVQKAIEETEKMKDIFEEARQGLISKSRALKIYNENFGEVYGTAKNFNEAESIFIKKTPYYLQAIQARETAAALYKIAAEKQAKALISYSNKENTTIEELKAYAKALFNAKNPKELKKLQEEDEKKSRDERKKQADAENEQIFQLAREQMDIAQKAAKMGQLEIDGVNAVKKEKEEKKIDNIFKDLLSGFKKDLETLNQADLQGLSLINAKAEQNYKERLSKIADALKDKKITGIQAGILRRIVGLVKKAEIETETKKFNEERLAALDEANKQMDELQLQHQQNQLDILDEGYQKQINTIKFEEETKIKAIEEVRTDKIKAIKALQDAEYYDEATARYKIVELNKVIEQLILDAKLDSNKKQQEANLQHLKDIAENYETERNLIITYLEIAESDELLALNKKRQKGLISEGKYQEEKLKLQKSYADKIKQSQITTLEELISEQEKILTGSLSEKDQQDAAAKLAEYKKKLNELLSKDNTEDIPFEDTIVGRLFGWDPTDTSKNGGAAKIHAAQKLVQQTIQTSIDLLKEQARLEVEAYDRAISLQQGRVDEARKIADAGNAEYLKQETDRLNQLEAKREASARRQLEIDQAIQASQILVAVAGAAAQIAKGGTVNVITGIASVIAAIGSGISLVNQMKNNAPKFYDGTEYVELNGNPDGRDTIPAWVNKGERIVPTEINKQLKGIKNKDLPRLVSGELFYNHMVQVSDKDLQKRDNNADLRKEIQGLKEIQAEQLEALKSLKMHVKLDEEGFMAGLETASLKRKKMFNA